MFSQCLACERGIQIPRDHMFPFAHSCTSLASIIRKSDLFYTCSGSADNIHDYPSHISCFSERRGQCLCVHMCTCSSACVETGREGRACCLRQKGDLRLIFGFYQWAPLTVSQTGHRCFLFALPFTQKKQLMERLSISVGLILILPSPAFSNLKIYKFSYLYLML